MLHHDLKSRNVLLCNAQSTPVGSSAVGSSPDAEVLLTAKIGDFGLTTGISRTTYGESSTTRCGGGTLAYKAPETFRNE